jgi:hypothetical protein
MHLNVAVYQFDFGITTSASWTNRTKNGLLKTMQTNVDWFAKYLGEKKGF